MKIDTILLIIVIVLSSINLSFTITQRDVTAASTSTTQIEQQEIVKLINKYRSSEGKEPLYENKLLNTSAHLKASDMKNRAYWEHDTPDGKKPWTFFDKAGYDWTKAGENLAKCYGTDQEVVDAWIKSPAHNKAMLGDYEEIGVSKVQIEDDCTLVVAHFGK